MCIRDRFYAATWWAGAAAGLVVAVIFAIKGKGLTTVAAAACAAVFLAELLQSIFL